MEKVPASILTKAGLRKTQIRIQVLQSLLEEDVALSSNELESRLQGVDRITLYRTLRSFEQKGIIHQINDGTQCFKYALCSGGCNEHRHTDEHAHFHCEKCGITICLPGIEPPPFKVPEGYVVKTYQLILQGTCPDCAILENEDPNLKPDHLSL